MVFTASDLIHAIPYPEDQETYDIYNKMAAAAAAVVADTEYLVIHEQPEPIMPVNKESPHPHKEKQIYVDHKSLKESSDHPIFSLPRINTPTLLLPSSATSSPLFNSNLLKTKHWKNQKQASSLLINSLVRQHSAMLSQSQLAPREQDSYLQRSKSCGEGRASALPDDFDLWLSKMNNNYNNNSIGHDQSRHLISGFSNIEMSKMEEINRSGRTNKIVDPGDEKFKCGALCLFLPGFGKGKPVRLRRKEEAEMITGHVVSRTVSLEKFECGSWTSSAIMTENEEEEEEDQGRDSTNNLFFDLPLELIRSSVNDAHSPVKAAFVFDKDVKGGVLKNGGAAGTSSRATGCRKFHESSSSRHVRFSTSSPMPYPTSPSSSCITPRLRKARDDFNAFLEAQSA